MRGMSRFLVAFVLLCLALPPLAHGASAISTAIAAAYFLTHVLAPGWILARVLVPSRAESLERLALALVLGLATEGLAFLGAKAAGIEGAFSAYPLLFAPLVFFHTRRRHRDERVRAPTSIGRAAGAVFVVLLVVCVLRTPFLAPDQWWARQDADLLFHVGNAAEFARHWPMQDPRVADTPLVYHLLSYALPASAHVVLGMPVAELATLHQAGVGPLVLVLATFAAARALCGNAWAGVVAAGLVVLHTGLMQALRDAFGVSAPGLNFQSHFDTGVFHSATTRAGLAAFAALVLIGSAWFRAESARWKLAVAAALVAGYASGAKGSVLPIVVAGLGFAIGVEALRTRRVPIPGLALLAVVIVGGAPFTLWLVGGESSYAGAMFRIAPMTPMRSAGPFVALANSLGHEALLAPWWLVAVCAPLWWILHSGAALVGACTGLTRSESGLPRSASGLPRSESAPARSESTLERRAPALDTTSVWLFGTAIAGCASASLVAAAGYSELFFAYNGQLALAILAGVAVVRAVQDRRRVALALFLVFAAPLAAAGLARTWASVREVRAATPESALARSYRAGLDWIRDESPTDAVFVTAGSWTNVSAFGERRAFVESERFTPAWHAARWEEVEGRWFRLRTAERVPSARMAAREALREDASAVNVARAREWVPSAPLYLVSDHLVPTAGPGRGCAVAPAPDQEHLRASSGLEPVFSNEAMAIYRVR